ncbi:hypothetical protein BC829DRAFT_433311 [Chytridium lagenaria]|nr:hypothetical protein BC829DRAFT_433311 [Chytridium lagenaria]
MAAMDVDEEEDYVVKEIPVFLSQQLADTLYLLQYPNRRQRVEAPLAARFKPNGRRFEMDIHWRFPAVITRAKALDKILLSSHILPQAHSFFVGAVQDGISCYELESMVQMRPSLKYKDKIAEKERALTQRLQSDEAQIKKPAGEEDARLFKDVSFNQTTRTIFAELSRDRKNCLWK